MRLNNKRALVTGGASGIGLAIAKAFRAEGCQVIVGDLQDAEGFDSPVMDVSSWDSVRAAMTEPFYVLVNSWYHAYRKAA